jgi:hypothetical protein
LGESQKSAGNNLTLRPIIRAQMATQSCCGFEFENLKKKMRGIEFFAGHVTARFEMIPGCKSLTQK